MCPILLLLFVKRKDTALRHLALRSWAAKGGSRKARKGGDLALFRGGHAAGPLRAGLSRERSNGSGTGN
jgi:hypothetical protein